MGKVIVWYRENDFRDRAIVFSSEESLLAYAKQKYLGANNLRIKKTEWGNQKDFQILNHNSPMTNFWDRIEEVEVRDLVD